MKKIKSMTELGIVLEIGDLIIKEMNKQFPKMELGKPYKGKYKKYIIEYINLFIIKDAKESIKDNNLDSIKEDLWQEVAFISCFCKWLEEEKGVLPSKTK